MRLQLRANKNNRLFYFFICLYFTIQPTYGDTINTNKIWLGFDIENSIKPNSKWYYDFFVQPRFADNQILTEQVIIRPAFYYQYNDNWSYWLVSNQRLSSSSFAIY